MIKKVLFGLSAILILLSGCEFQSFKDFEYEPYDGVLKWNQVSAKAEWPARYGHAAVNFDGKLWIAGGYNPGKVKGDTYYEDVWSSDDGINWVLVTDSAPWKGRRGHQMVVFNDGESDAMYLIGGFEVNESDGFRRYANDVWKSYDGIAWEEIKAATSPELTSEEDWYPRFNHSLLISRYQDTDYLYLIGGACMLTGVEARYSMKYFNDVWRSSDGVNWERIMANDFGIRSEAGSAVDPVSGRMYIQGGIHGVMFDSEEGQSHPIENWEKVWYSDDGAYWQLDTLSEFDESLLWRSDHELIWYHDRIWALPGKTTSNAHYHFTNGNQYPVWTIGSDGLMDVDSYGSDMDPRHGYAAVVFDQKIYIMGGFTSSRGQLNDVWSAEIK